MTSNLFPTGLRGLSCPGATQSTSYFSLLVTFRVSNQALLPRLVCRRLVVLWWGGVGRGGRIFLRWKHARILEGSWAC